MELTFVNDFRSIKDPLLCEGELPDLVILTGPNGSGKTNLLEAIFGGSILVSGVESAPGNPQQNIRHFPMGGLTAQAGGAVAANQVSDTADVLHATLLSVRAEISGGGTTVPPGVDKHAHHNEYVRNRMSQSYGWPLSFFEDLEEAAKKNLIDFDFDDLRHYVPTIVNQDAFSLSIAEAFTRYHKRYIDNKLIAFQIAEGEDPGMTSQTSEQFRTRNGLPPWDQVNDLLVALDMKYRINRPVGHNPNLPYEPRLTRLNDGVEISVDDLSSGERTLMALVISLYTGSTLHPGSVVMPQLILLDEPDASLHPSMVRHLLRVVRDTFVNQHGVKVLLTTHSPTTVALAPAESLYVMRADALPRILKVSRDRALASLLVGVPTLSVSNDNRRQIFVEAEVDADCYLALFTKLRESINSPLSLAFIPAGTGGKTSWNQVVEMVSALRTNGIKVLGVVDRDNDQKQLPTGVVEASDRYSLENLILDPVAIGLLLVREAIESAETVFGSDVTFFNADADHAQNACTYVASCVRQYVADTYPLKLSSFDNGSKTSLAYDNGIEVIAPEFTRDCQGHQWEGYLLEAFPKLKKFKHRLKHGVLDLIYSDLPGYMPADVRKLFRKLIEFHDDASAE